MAEKLEIVGKVVIDSKDAEKSLAQLREDLQKSNEELIKVESTFGKLSPEAINAAEKVAILQNQISEIKNTQIAAPIETLQEELKVAESNLQNVVNTFGELSPEAQQATSIVKDLKTQIESLHNIEPGAVLPKLNEDLQNANINLQSVVSTFGELSPEAEAARNAVKDLEAQIVSLQNIPPSEALVSLNQDLISAESNLKTVIDTFGALSPEAKNATQNVNELKNKISEISAQKIDEPINALSAKLIEAETNLQSVVASFGELSPEAQNAAAIVNDLKTRIQDINTIKPEAPIKSLNEQLNEAEVNLKNVVATFGELSPEAANASKQVENIKNQISSVGKDDISVPVQNLQEQLKIAEVNLQKVIATFGEFSPEANQASQAVENLKSQISQVGEVPVDAPVKSLKAQLKEAQIELQNVADKFGLTSKEAQEAAKRVADLKDRIGDAKLLSEGFNPDAKFKALSSALSGVAGGFAAIQGAQALFGEQSKDLEKTLVKVQGALALSQGINSVLELKDTFKVLKVVAVDAFNGIKAAIGSTGIGLLVVALGAIVAYWDDITEAVSGVSAEQKKLNAETEKNLKASEDNLKAVSQTENSLKLQGKSEKEILQLKIAQYDIAIKNAELSVQNAEFTKKAQVEASERNKNILEGIIRLVTAPIQILLKGIDSVASALGKNLNLADKFTGGIANLVFDPKEVAKEGDEAIKTAKDKLAQLKNDRDGAQLRINAIDKEASDKRKENAKKEADELAKLQKEASDRRIKNALETDKLIQENRLNAIKDGYQKIQETTESQYQNEIDQALDQLNKRELTQEEYNQRRAAIDEKYNLIRAQNEDNFEKQQAERRLKNQQETEKLILDARLAVLQEGATKQQLILENEYQNQIDTQLEQLNKGIINEEEYAKRREQIDIIYAEKKKNLENQIALETANKELQKIDETINNAELEFQARKDAIEREEAFINNANIRKLIGEEQYNKRFKALADARIKIGEEEKKFKVAQQTEIANRLGQLADLIGKQTAAGKALAIAQTLINTYQGVSNVLAEKSTLPQPFSTISRIVNVATTVASGIKAVKEIVKVQVPGGGGGSSTPSGVDVGSTAPISATPETTALPQDQINQLTSANASVRSYVLETDIANNQERITRLNRASRIN